MNLALAQYYTYMTDYQRTQAEALDLLAKAEACCPYSSAESREWSEAFYMDCAFNSRKTAAEWAKLAVAEMRERVA